MVGTHMPRVPSVDRGRRVYGCTWLGRWSRMCANFQCPQRFPQNLPRYGTLTPKSRATIASFNDDVYREWRPFRGAITELKIASNSPDSVKALTPNWSCDPVRHIVT